MFEKIVSYDNLKAAYLEIAEKFAADRKNFFYHGLDNFSFKDYDLDSHNLILEVQKELHAKTEIEPAISIRIPKKSNPEKTREIFIYNVKERVKAQAIARVLLPEFEKNFSDRLFSYRPNRPPYLAAKSFCHRYRTRFGSDSVLVVDLENYSDLIDKEMLISKLEKIFFDADVLDLLRLFVFNKIYRGGEIQEPKVGLVQGVPLIALFTNLYLADLDFKYQRLVSFYVRVGDDIALLDQDQNKLDQIKMELISDLQAKKLTINPKKLFSGPASGKFNFLGYNFNQGVISLEPSFIRRIESGWKRILTYQHLSDVRKNKLVKVMMARPEQNFNSQFFKIVQDKSQLNNTAQIKKLSENFFKIMTKFFFKHYSPRNRRLLSERLSGLPIRSLYSIYQKFHYERD